MLGGELDQLLEHLHGSFTFGSSTGTESASRPGHKQIRPWVSLPVPGQVTGIEIQQNRLAIGQQRSRLLQQCSLARTHIETRPLRWWQYDQATGVSSGNVGRGPIVTGHSTTSAAGPQHRGRTTHIGLLWTGLQQ